MSIRLLGGPTALSLALGLAFFGCGGKGAEVDTATVDPDPSTVKKTAPPSNPAPPAQAESKGER